MALQQNERIGFYIRGVCEQGNYNVKQILFNSDDCRQAAQDLLFEKGS